jgi:hypothetical protein
MSDLCVVKVLNQLVAFSFKHLGVSALSQESQDIMGRYDSVLVNIDTTEGLEWLQGLQTTQSLSMNIDVLFSFFETDEELAYGLTQVKRRLVVRS